MCRAAALPPLTWIAFPAFPRLRHRTETEEFELMLMRLIWALLRLRVKCAHRNTTKRSANSISSRQGVNKMSIILAHEAAACQQPVNIQLITGITLLKKGFFFVNRSAAYSL